MDKKRSDMIYYLKGLSIISVVYAHCGNRVSYNAVDALLNSICKNVGTIGVPLFFIISGYLYNNKKPFLDFWHGKLNIIISWVFWGFVVWVYEIMRKGLDYANLFEWILGIGTYLWFMHTIMIFWLMFYFFKSKNMRFFSLIFAISYYVITYDLGFQTRINSYGILNDVLCHMPFFTFGLCLKEGFFEKVKEIIMTRKYIRLGGAILCLILAVLANNNNLFYGSPLFLTFILGSGICCLELVNKLNSNQKIGRGLKWLGGTVSQYI